MLPGAPQRPLAHSSAQPLAQISGNHSNSHKDHPERFWFAILTIITSGILSMSSLHSDLEYLFKSLYVKSTKCPSLPPEEPLSSLGFQQLSFAAAQQLWSDSVIEVWTSQSCLRCGGEVANGIKLLSFFYQSAGVRCLKSNLIWKFLCSFTNLSLCLLL